LRLLSQPESTQCSSSRSRVEGVTEAFLRRSSVCRGCEGARAYHRRYHAASIQESGAGTVSGSSDIFPPVGTPTIYTGNLPDC
jgi:hypothetical protein